MVPFGGPYMTFHWLANVSKTKKKCIIKIDLALDWQQHILIIATQKVAFLSMESCTIYELFMLNNTVTFKSRLGVIQDH